MELDVEMNYCPLCGQKSTISETTGRIEKHTGKLTGPVDESYNFQDLTKLQRRKVLWQLMMIMFLTGVATTVVIDLIINARISWSKYTLAVGFFLIINASLLAFMQRRVFLLMIFSFLSTSLLLLLLDWFSHDPYWGIHLGVPLIGCLYVILLALIKTIQYSKRKGINIIAYSLIAAGIMGLCTEGIVSFYLHEHVSFMWSLILGVSITAVSTILLFIHFNLQKGTGLKRFFHI